MKVLIGREEVLNQVELKRLHNNSYSTLIYNRDFYLSKVVQYLKLAIDSHLLAKKRNNGGDHND
jgi:hypothetical protein